MNKIPTLETARLKLRPYSEADIAELVPLIGAREVAATTFAFRIPIPSKTREIFSFSYRSLAGSGWRLLCATMDRQIGGVGLYLEEQNQHAELGYWLGVPYWGKGYATEAAREMLRYGFEDLQLHRIFASHFKHNPASGRILRKLGMRYEGCQREHLRKWDQFVDSELYGMLRHDWEHNG